MTSPPGTDGSAVAVALVAAYLDHDLVAVHALLADVGTAARRLEHLDPIGASIAADRDDTHAIITGLVALVIALGTDAYGSRDELRAALADWQATDATG